MFIDERDGARRTGADALPIEQEEGVLTVGTSVLVQTDGAIADARDADVSLEMVAVCTVGFAATLGEHKGTCAIYAAVGVAGATVVATGLAFVGCAVHEIPDTAAAYSQGYYCERFAG